jgi:hypothetical protein
MGRGPFARGCRTAPHHTARVLQPAGKQSLVLVSLVVLLLLGCYAVFAQQQQSAPQQYQQPMGGGMMGGGMGPGMMQGGGMGPGMMQGGMMGRGMGRGMMPPGRGPLTNPGCAGCRVAWGALAHESVTATSDGGVVVAVAGKLIKYDSALKKVAETNVEVNWAEVHERMQQMIQNCPFRQPQTAAPRPAQPSGPVWQGQPNPPE